MTKTMTREEMIAAIKNGSIVDVLKDKTFISFGAFTMDEQKGLTKQESKGSGGTCVLKS